MKERKEVFDQYLIVRGDASTSQKATGFPRIMAAPGVKFGRGGLGMADGSPHVVERRTVLPRRVMTVARIECAEYPAADRVLN